jgi:hypothetical protein
VNKQNACYASPVSILYLLNAMVASNAEAEKTAAAAAMVAGVEVRSTPTDAIVT